MARKEIVESECDGCGTAVRMDMPKQARGAFILPPGWLHVAGNTATAFVFEVDLCEVCKVSVLNAAGLGRLR